jgi:hypothetical protein
MPSKEFAQRFEVTAVLWVVIDDVVREFHHIPYRRTGGFQTSTKILESQLDLSFNGIWHNAMLICAYLASSRDDPRRPRRG